MSDPHPRRLDLAQLAEGLRGVTCEAGGAMAQAAAVCFEEQAHRSGAAMLLDGDCQRVYCVRWSTVTQQMRNTHNDYNRCTEDGAYGVTFLLILDTTKYTVVKKSRIGTGVDWWLGRKNGGFQSAARLEVSGIRGQQQSVSQRTQAKLKQTARSDGRLPAFVSIVDFRRPAATLRRKP